MTTYAETLHTHLIGRQGSRRALNTPALVVDADALERNIAAMSSFAATNGLKLRPHAKTHKSIDIAKAQIAAGALGVCCAKLGEAEALRRGRHRGHPDHLARGGRGGGDAAGGARREAADADVVGR